MVLEFGQGDLFKDNGLFRPSPEDGQIDAHEGSRKIPTDDADTDTILLSPLESSLNILELQAASAITPVTHQGLRIDTFSDADGYTNTVDTANTTAVFNTDGYTNNQDINDSTEYKLASWPSYAHAHTYTFSVDTIVAEVDNLLGGGQSSQDYWCKVIFVYFDATSSEVVRTSDGTYVNRNYPNPNPTKLVSNIQLWLRDDSSSTCNVKNNIIDTSNVNVIVQTDIRTIATGESNFQVVAYRNSTTGTGNITADISFDNGVHYQTAVPLNTNTQIVNGGTQMILKLNLNAGVSGGSAECKGYGVSLW